MELARLIEGLAAPSAYPFPVDHVDVRQTHLSAVFLAGDFAYKIKKPVRFEFVDFSNLAQRRHFCDEEVRLNRRLAPSVYLGVVPVTHAEGRWAIEGSGEPVEWAVKMLRLPESATLHERLDRQEVQVQQIEALAMRIAAFHAAAKSNATIASFGSFDRVAENLHDNFAQSTASVGTTISPTVFARLKILVDAQLSRLRSLMEARAARGMPRDTHGDLRLDHVYLFPEKQPADDMAIIDCIEFNESFRFADPIADMAFLVMDLSYAGRADLASAFGNAYFHASGDEEGRRLLPLYVSYRAAVRAKVEALKLAESEVPASERLESRQLAQGHWLLSLGALETPEQRPCLVLVGGLPGTGKSTLAHALAERAHLQVIRSDQVRKELVTSRSPNYQQQDLYSAEWNGITYAECLRRATRLLFEGQRVIVDANFREDHQRQAFLTAAKRWAVPAVFLWCTADPTVVRVRLAQRQNDASDADCSVYEKLAPLWEEFGPLSRAMVREVKTDRDAAGGLQQGLAALREAGLL